MPYVDRDLQGGVVGIYAAAQYDEQEFVDGDVELQPPFSQPAALQRARDKRDGIFKGLDWLQLRALALQDMATAQAIEALKQGLRGITSQADVLAANDDDDFDAIVLAHYKQMVAGAPPAIVAAFVGVAS